jgi:flavorubredoxin
MPEPIRIADDTFGIPLALPIPGIGELKLMPLVIRGPEPVLVDTGPPIDRDGYLASAFSLIDPESVRWIFLSHDDRDHSGNLMQLLERCPNATLLTTFVAVGRMSEEWAVPLNRIRLLNDGESVILADRTLTALTPPFFDCPATRGLWDSHTGMYYAVDSFGAPTPGACEDVTDVPEDVYRANFNMFNRMNHPWHELVDPGKLARRVNRVRELQAQVIVSYHGPVARNRSDEMCDMLCAIASMESLPLPTQAELDAMVRGAPAPAAVS